MSRQAALFHARERRRSAERYGSFAGLIASPHDIGASAVALPSAGVIGVSASVSVTAGDLSIATTLSGRTIETPDLSADEIHLLGFLEQGDTLDVTFSGGDVSLYVYEDWRDSFAVFAQGTFA